METQVALVSAQPMPTLILAFQRRPRKIALMTTREMEERAGWLKDVLGPKGIKAEMISVDAYDLPDIQEKIGWVFLQEENPVLNVTGGTKIMALGAFLEAERHGVPVYYVDTAFGLIRDLKRNASEAIHGRITIKAYLQAHGFQMTSCKTLQDLLSFKILLSILEKNLIKKPKLLASWNSLFSRVSPEELETDGIESVQREIQKIFTEMAEAGFGRYEGERYFCDEEIRAYLLGEWLEDYVFHQINDLKPDDLARGVEVVWEKEAPGSTANEFDILFTKNFRLYYVSCKTSLMQGEHGHSKSALYELVALRERIAGLFGKAMLVTMRKLSDVDFHRARRMGITVVQGKDLNNLRSILARWAKE